MVSQELSHCGSHLNVKDIHVRTATMKTLPKEELVRMKIATSLLRGEHNDLRRSLDEKIITVYMGHGIQFVHDVAKIFHFCRSKCHKSFKMKRNPREVKWTKAYRRVHGKDMTKDLTFEFEKKRNRPEKYDRNVKEDVLKAISKIAKIRATREETHHKKISIQSDYAKPEGLVLVHKELSSIL
ncbi:probable ribosome biogenesis protein RLP24 [Lotus japonicus]|uniref:probable ribosome biogenesis protein RLP24 n=1 Tax=Lotus japonicus TaxID=34305 RepID=UPI002582ABA2|nr:probable ribosome biogenesis protein RLP24 [Lotus japonicus]